MDKDLFVVMDACKDPAQKLKVIRCKDIEAGTTDTVLDDLPTEELKQITGTLYYDKRPAHRRHPPS